MPEAEPLLRLKAVTKRYPGVVANDAVDLDVKAGEIHAILGENGAGKSTLVKMIYGSIRPESGEIAWEGRPTEIQSPSMARDLGIGMVFQHFSLFETLTVAENISLAVSEPMSSLSGRIRTVSAEFGLDVEPEARVQSLSVGERQRIEIVRCILQNPRLIIMDEPTSVLPPQGIAKLFETLRSLAENGIAIIFISHKLEEIRALCDRATVMRGGRVVGEADPKQETASALARMMIGRDIPQSERSSKPVSGHPVLTVTGLDHVPDNPFSPSLNGINLSLKAGEVLGIAGVSGNGQDALTRLLSGEITLSREKSDQVELNGAAIGAMGPAARRALGLNFVPEERLGRGAVPVHTLAENSGLTTFHRGLVNWGLVNLGTRRRRAEDTIQAMDVRCRGADSTARSLSGGNLQKFIVGRELSMQPKVLIAAQPTWGVDIGAAAAIRQKLINLCDEGVAVMVVSEELEELFEISDRMQVMFRGRISPPVPTRETSIEVIGQAMAGDFEALTRPNAVEVGHG